jgi:cystathionine beta-synthase
MSMHKNIIEAIGNTPLVKLNRVVLPNSADVYAKCEYTNPGGSVKDRMAMFIVKKAIASGKLKPGGVIVENTSGNTGAGQDVAGEDQHPASLWCEGRCDPNQRPRRTPG